MNRSRINLAFVACVGALLSGCADLEAQGAVNTEELDVGFQPESSSGTREPPAGTNGDIPTCLWAADTQAALRYLASGKLDSGGGVMPTVSLVDPSCREILRTAVKCALSKELAVQDGDTGELYEGWWGLEPQWLKSPLSPAGRRWVTACMIQKLNATGTKVPILMEGDTPSLYTNTTLDAEIPFDDSTAFGDMFSSTADLDQDVPPFQVYVCTDVDLVTTCGSNLGSPWTQYRICDGVTNCGMTFIGACASACDYASGYPVCRDPSGAQWTETVHVQYEGFPGYCL